MERKFCLNLNGISKSHHGIHIFKIAGELESVIIQNI